MTTDGRDEAARLEGLWSGDFGDAYTERNVGAGEVREMFWRGVLARAPISSVLEVGCNLGANLRWLAAGIPDGVAVGLDINAMALAQLKRAMPSALVVRGSARALPFVEDAFDMVATVGVLIHQPEQTLPTVMREIVRCARRYVMCAEYYAPTSTEVSYRGQPGALFKRDYGALYARQAPSLVLQDQGFLSRSEGWDDVTFWLFEKT